MDPLEKLADNPVVVADKALMEELSAKKVKSVNEVFQHLGLNEEQIEGLVAIAAVSLAAVGILRPSPAMILTLGFALASGINLAKKGLV